MGIQCTVFGHVYDGTEFEEHRTERPRGEVLICREYQVCRRCGNRTEMYRNEQLLTPRPESEGRQADEPAENAGPTADAPVENPEDEREEPENEVKTPSDSGAAPEGDGPSDAFRIEDSPTPSTVSGEGSEGDDRHSVATPGADTTREPPSVENSPADSSQSDDAVILTDGASAPESTASAGDRGDTQTTPSGGTDPTPLFDHDGDDGDVECPACGQVWNGNATSLRDGDICPSCGRGYVEEN